MFYVCVNVCVCVCMYIYTAVTVKVVNKPIASTVFLHTPQATAHLLFVIVITLCFLGSPVNEVTCAHSFPDYRSSAWLLAVLLHVSSSASGHSRVAAPSTQPLMDTGCSCWGCYEHVCTSLCEDVCISFSWVNTHNVMAEL